jgi:[acyl-carrier-protein] S-malonyltransferase
MGTPWLDHPSWSLVARLSDVVGRDLAHLLVEAGPDTLKATRNAQLATYTLSLVVLDAARRGPLGSSLSEPAPGAGLVAVAGHSLGEYTALVAAGALDAENGALLVQARGEAMQAAAEENPGTMAAILGLELAGVAEACSRAGQAWVANDNTPGQVVVAGTLTGVAAAGQQATALGAKRVIGLQVGGAFHSPLMEPAQGPLDEALGLAPLGPAPCPVVANVDARAHRDGFAALVSAQLCSRVRWRESLATLEGLGTTLFVELGPGAELSGMVKRAVPRAARANVAGPDDLSVLADALAAGTRATGGSP